MPIVKIHVLEGQYDEPRHSNVSKAAQDALMSVLKMKSRSLPAGREKPDSLCSRN